MTSSWARSLTRFARTRSIGTGAGARVCCSTIHFTKRPPPISEYTAAIGSAIAVSNWKGGLTGPVSAAKAVGSKGAGGYGYGRGLQLRMWPVGCGALPVRHSSVDARFPGP